MPGGSRATKSVLQVVLTVLVHVEPVQDVGKQLTGSSVGWCALLAAMTLSSYCGMYQMQQCQLQGSPDMWQLSSRITFCAHALVLALTVITMLIPVLHVQPTSETVQIIDDAVNCSIMRALLTIAAVIMAAAGCKELFTILSSERLESAYNAVSTSDRELQSMPQLQFSTVECRTTQPSKQMYTVVVSNVVATRKELRNFFGFHGEIKAVKHLNKEKSVVLIEFVRAAQAEQSLVFDNTTFNNCTIRVEMYEHAHIPVTCNQMYEARVDQSHQRHNSDKSARRTKSNPVDSQEVVQTESESTQPFSAEPFEIFVDSVTEEDEVAMTLEKMFAIRVDSVTEEDEVAMALEKLEGWRASYATDGKIPPAMKRHCKQHGIDKAAAVKMLKYRVES